MSLDEVGHSPRRLCWFCGVEQVAAAPASYQAYLALYEMDGEVEIERRTIGRPRSDYRAVAIQAVAALRSVNTSPQ
jgi:hypothetical protein